MAMTGAGSGSRLRVNPIRCDGAQYCAEIVPELVSLDEWGYPIVSSAAIDDPRLLRLAERAVSECPRVALQLARSDDRER
jgi:ferredoxin